jgi:2-alkyl-3-oxoalkanoate reductase
LADELVPLAIDAAAPAVASGAQTLSALEARVLQSASMRGTVLRYGFFYGPDTWYARDGSSADQAGGRKSRLLVKVRESGRLCMSMMP